MLPGRKDIDRVVREHGPAIYRQLRRMFGPHVDVEDLAQTVLLEVVRSLPRFAGRARLSTWIRRITWNVAFAEMRARYRQPVHESEDAVALWHEGPSPEEAAGHNEAVAKLYGALARMEPDLRVALTLCDLEGCTLEEVSRALGRPLPTIASRVKRARAVLAELVVRDDSLTAATLRAEEGDA